MHSPVDSAQSLMTNLTTTIPWLEIMKVLDLLLRGLADC